jgi:hypothetical protein
MTMAVLKKEREEGRKKRMVASGVVRYPAVMQAITNVTALTVAGLCLFLLLIWVDWKQVTELGCEVSKVMGSGLFQYVAQEMA